MQKSDKSIRNICVAAIKRHTMKPVDYPLSKVFDSEVLADIDKAISAAFLHYESELPIALTKLDDNNWTLLTTRQVVSKINGDIKQALPENIIQTKWNDFKENRGEPSTLAQLTLSDNSHLDVHIESGKASMIMIYGIMTFMKMKA